MYFFIHGGGFMWGSASSTEFGPDFLVQQDILVVTIQYRVGVFGELQVGGRSGVGGAEALTDTGRTDDMGSYISPPYYICRTEGRASRGTLPD